MSITEHALRNLVADDLDMGPVVPAEQHERVLGYVERAMAKLS